MGGPRAFQEKALVADFGQDKFEFERRLPIDPFRV